MVLDTAFIIVGFVLLIKGADWLVGGASGLAKKYHVSDMVIGLTIVALGTSAPELVVNSVASIDKQSDIVFGNVIGSNVLNLFVILGVVALIFPITVRKSFVRKEILFSLLIVALVMLLSNAVLGQTENILTRRESILLLVFFTGFLIYTFKQAAQNPENNDLEVKPMTNLKIWRLIIVGLIFLVAGGRMVVTGAENVAHFFGISEKIIALTIVAAGTSLPELVTSVVAASKKNSDIAVGNAIGSNIFNILFILPVSGLIHPISYVTSFNREMLLLMGGTLLLMLFMFIGEKYKMKRWQGGLFVAIFIAYTVIMIQYEL